MAKINLSKMSLDDLVALRDRVQSELTKKVETERAGLQKQLDALSTLHGAGQSNGSRQAPAKRRVALTKGPVGRQKRRAKVAPKYRGPEGETWSGRGLAPRWLAALESQGKKRESFLIKK